MIVICIVIKGFLYNCFTVTVILLGSTNIYLCILNHVFILSYSNSAVDWNKQYIRQGRLLFSYLWKAEKRLLGERRRGP